MSKAGYPYDNAPMERYFNTLKNDLIYQHYYRTEDESTQQSKNLRMCNIIMYVRILIIITKRPMRHATELHDPCGRN